MKTLIDTVAGCLCVAGLIFICIYGYGLIFGPPLQPDTTYRETTTRLGKELSSRIIHMVSKEETKKGTIKFFVRGVAMFLSGIAIIVWPSSWSPVRLLTRAMRKTGQEPDSSPMTDDEARQFIQQIPGRAEKHRELAKTVFDLDLDYTAESIPKLDQMIEEGWPKTPPADLDGVVLAFGSYLGESIRHLHGGDWCYSEANGIHFDVANRDIKIFPFSKVKKRFLNGDEDSLGYFYGFIRSQLGNET